MASLGGEDGADELERLLRERDDRRRANIARADQLYRDRVEEEQARIRRERFNQATLTVQRAIRRASARRIRERMRATRTGEGAGGGKVKFRRPLD